MEQLPIDSDNTMGEPDNESLSDYVQRMETDGNLRKLAMKLKDDLVKPVADENPDVPTRDLSFGKFEEKRKQRDGQ